MDDRHAVLREIIDLYVDSSRMERLVYLWEKKPNRRAQLYEELIRDACWFRDDRSTALVPALEDPAQIAARLRSLGFGKTCLIYGETDYRDPAEEGDLDATLAQYLDGARNAILLFCPKSKAAFVHGHSGNQLLLHIKPPAKVREQR